MSRPLSILSPLFLFCLMLSGCTFFGRFQLINQSKYRVHVAGFPAEIDSASLAHMLWYVKYNNGDGDPYFRDTVMEGANVLVADLAPNEEVTIGCCSNCQQDSTFIAFRTLVITDSTGKSTTLPTRAAIYERCTKKSGVGWTSKLVYTGE